MRKLTLTQESIIKDAKLLSSETGIYNILFPAAGGGISLPELKTCTERYFIFSIEPLTDHSVTIDLCFYTNGEKPTFYIRHGFMPRVKALVCIDLNWLDAGDLFPERNPGQLKVVCLGKRVNKADVTQVSIENALCYEDIEIIISDPKLSDEPPAQYPLPEIKLIDEFGQYKLKDWPGKIYNEEELIKRLHEAADPSIGNEYPVSDWDHNYGGCKRIRFGNGTGYFTKTYENGRWWLVDPLGYAFFSVGVDCVTTRVDCRIDEIEKFMDWLPEKENSEYGHMYQSFQRRQSHRTESVFPFGQVNMYRAFGSNWYERWLEFMPRRLKQAGINTIANWSDNNLFGKAKMPYVTTLKKFPGTSEFIFRDFPDVLSEEYARDAAVCAEDLKERAGDPYMIGYFLRNEPNWAFVDNLIIADEVLRNPARTACKTALVQWLIDKYSSVDSLNEAWNRTGDKCFYSFEDLFGLNCIEKNVSEFSKKSHDDMRAFSRILLNAYVTVPSKACRAADANHMNLGMRWAWISDPDLVTGWENFDVFSINCYKRDPVSDMDNVVRMGVDLPIMIGEFHFGALDRGLTATGLQAVMTQKDRGIAYRYYMERLAAHSHGVGGHYFQCYDQFALGRFDGENYNIGLFDICSQPHEEQTEAMRLSSEALYSVMSGDIKPYNGNACYIPMIAY